LCYHARVGATNRRRRPPFDSREAFMRRGTKAALAAASTLVAIGAVAFAAGDETAKTKDAGWTGSVSEEQFKAMHELETGAAPKLFGTMVDLAGGKAYLSLPAGAKPPLPGVVVIQEWWGLNDNIKHWADRLAAEGYAALAVDLYDGKLATNSDEASKYMQSV